MNAPQARAANLVNFEKKKQQCMVNRAAAYSGAATRLVSEIGVAFRVSEWTGRSHDAYLAQWPKLRHQDATWDWPEVFQQYRDFDRLPIVLWGPRDRLCGLGLGTISGMALTLNFLEGDFREGCPLRGRRALIALEVGARYAQSLGRTELRVEPANSSLVSLYRDTYGFIEFSPPKGHSYFRKEV